MAWQSRPERRNSPTLLTRRSDETGRGREEGMLSDNLRAETPSGRDYADALDDFLKALGVAGFNIVANSFGTRVAQSFAYHYPGGSPRGP